MLLSEIMEFVDTRTAVRIFESGSFKPEEAIIQFNGCPGLEYWDTVISEGLMCRFVMKIQACANALYIMVDDPEEPEPEPEMAPIIDDEDPF